VTLLRRPGGRVLVIGCDSCGGIGNKPLDVVQTPPDIVGYFTARVAVMEVLSVGAELLAVVDTLSVEMDPAGKEIIRGVRRLLDEAGFAADYMNGSTEENFVTSQTGLGVTVIGEVAEDKLKLKRSLPGDWVVMLGEPMTGIAVLESGRSICSLKQLKLLAASYLVHEVIPVGSKGSGYEADLLAELNGCTFEARLEANAQLTVSGGPSTSVIFSIAEGNLKAIQEEIGGAMQVIGALKRA
jgi:hypothetical protein